MILFNMCTLQILNGHPDRQSFSCAAVRLGAAVNFTSGNRTALGITYNVNLTM